MTSTKNKTLSGLLQVARIVVGEAHLSVTKVVPDQVAIIAAVIKNPLSPLRYRMREISAGAGSSNSRSTLDPISRRILPFQFLLIDRAEGDFPNVIRKREHTVSRITCRKAKGTCLNFIACSCTRSEC